MFIHNRAWLSLLAFPIEQQLDDLPPSTSSLVNLEQLVGGGDDLSSSNHQQNQVFRLVFTPLSLKVGLTCLLAQCILTTFFSKLSGSNLLRSRGSNSIWSMLGSPGYIAHQIIVLPIMVYLVCQGTVEWFSNIRDNDNRTTAMDRIVLLQRSTHFSDIVFGMMFFWDIPVTILVKELRNAPMMVHHIAMMVTAAISMGIWSNDGRRLFGYYAPFFFGMSEISTLPLVVMDFVNSHPDLTLANPKLQTLQDWAGPMFAVLFLTVRAMYFPYVSVSYVLPDIVKVASKGICVRPLYVMALLNVLFTLLQLYWGSLIVKEIVKLVVDGTST